LICSSIFSMLARGRHLCPRLFERDVEIAIVEFR
jgi:hypothetical protein